MSKERHVCFITGAGTYAVPAEEVERILEVDFLDDRLLLQAVEYLPRTVLDQLLAKGRLLNQPRVVDEYIPYIAYL